MLLLAKRGISITDETLDEVFESLSTNAMEHCAAAAGIEVIGYAVDDL